MSVTMESSLCCQAAFSSPARDRCASARVTAISCWWKASNASCRCIFISALERESRFSFSWYAFNLFSSSLSVCSVSFISLSRDSRLVMRLTELPPVMEPPTFITSPSRVTRRNCCRPARWMGMPFCRSSAITVRPSRLSTMPRYLLSNVTISEATPTPPGILKRFLSPASSVRPLTALMGRKVARPKRFCLRNSISSRASSSVSTTMFCSAGPRAVSMAFSMFLSAWMMFATTPCTLFMPRRRASSSTCLTEEL